MIDEMAETTTTAEAFDLERMVAIRIAAEDAMHAAAEEERKRKQRETQEAAKAVVWSRVVEGIPEPMRAALEMTGAEWDDREGIAYVPFQAFGTTFHLRPYGSDWRLWNETADTLVCRIDTSGYGDGLATELVAGLAAVKRSMIDREEEVDTSASLGSKTKSSKTWEPQVLGSDGYRTTYLLDVDTGCGSLTQHALTVAEITNAGEVTFAQCFVGRAGDPNSEPIETFKVSGSQMRALWPLWQQVTAKSQATDADAPF